MEDIDTFNNSSRGDEPAARGHYTKKKDKFAGDRNQEMISVPEDLTIN